MTTVQITAALAAWVVATAIVCYLAFRFGYNLGWEERHRSMILPRNVRTRLNQRLDDNDQHDRHSAIEPTKVF